MDMNNMTYRMGDLRTIHGETGAWARIFSGIGYSNR